MMRSKISRGMKLAALGLALGLGGGACQAQPAGQAASPVAAPAPAEAPVPSAPAPTVAPAAAVAPADPPAALAAPEPVDPDMARGLDGLVTGCAVDVQDGLVTACEDDQLQTLLEHATRRTSPAVLQAFTDALSGEAPRATAASVVLAELWAQAPAAVLEHLDADDATALLASVAGRDTAQALQLAPLAAVAALKAGKTDALLELLREHPAARVRVAVWRHWLVARRLADFEELRPFADYQDEAAVTVALEAVLQMAALAQLSAEERETVCPWARPLMTHEAQEVAATAGRVMLLCGDEDAKSVVAMLGRRVEKGEYALPLSHLAIALCKGEAGAVAPDVKAGACEVLTAASKSAKVHPTLKARAKEAVAAAASAAETP